MPAHWSRRRALAALATAPAASLAGCGALRSATDGEERTYTLHFRDLDESLAEHLLWSPDELESPGDDLEATARRRAVEDGQFTTYGFSPISAEGEYTEYGGSYYRLSVVVTGRRPMDRYVLRLRWLGEEGDDGVPEPDAEIDELPGIDRSAAMAAYFAARSREYDSDGGPEEITERGGYVYRRDGSERSVLVPDSKYDALSQHGTVLRVEVNRERVREPAYSVVATEIGNTKAEYASAVDAAHLDVRLSPDALSEEQRRMVRRAMGESYEESTPLPEAYDGLLEALDVDDVDEGVARRYVRYDGRDYEYELYVNPS